MIVVRPAQKSDANSVNYVRAQSWIATYTSPEHGITKAQIKNIPWIIRALSGQELALVTNIIDIVTEDTQCFVAIDSDTEKVVGMAWPHRDEETHKARVGSIYILPEYIGQSIGRKLLKEVFEFWGNQDIYLTAVTYNTHARNFYEKQGFVYTGLTEIHEKHGVSLPVVEMVHKSN